MRFLRFQRSTNRRDQPRRRWLRWAAWTFGALAVVFAGACLVAVEALHSLERPWIKGRLQALVRSAAGVDIDYRSARVDLTSGADVEELVVRSPEEVRRFAPDLARLGRVEARWSLRSLLGGGGPRVASLSVSDVTLTIVVDERGRTTFDAFPPSPPSPTVPLSHLASTYLAGDPPLGGLAIDPATIVLLRTANGAIVDRATLEGLAVTLAMRPAGLPTRGWRVDGQLGSPDRDFRLARTRSDVDEGAARGKLLLAIDATPESLGATLDLRMTEQTFAATVAADHWLHAEAALRFDPKAGRTAIAVEHTEAGDGAATAEASIDLPDTGDPTVRRAHGVVDLARLVHWLPPGLVPVTAERARLRYDVDGLVAGPVARMADDGAVTIDVDLSNVTVRDPSIALDVSAATLTLHAKPADGGIAAQGSLKIAHARWASEAPVALDDATIDVDGRQASDGALAGTLDVHFASVERPGAILARDGHAAVRAQGLHLDTRSPLATRGDVALSFDVASLDLRAAASRTLVDGLALHAHATLEGHEPYALELEAPAKHVRVLSAGRPVADGPARLELRAHDLYPDATRPIASRGVVTAAFDLGDLRATLAATKEADAVDFTLGVTARSLSAVRPFLPPDALDAAPWDRMAAHLTSAGRTEHLAGDRPWIRHATEIHLEHPAFENAAAQSLTLKLRSQGTAMQHQADAELDAPGLAFAGGSAADERVTLAATVDREHPSLKLDLTTAGHATSKLAGTLSFDPGRRALRYDLDGHLGGLGPLSPFAAKTAGLTGLDLSELAVDVAAHGALLGVVAGVGRDGTVAYEAAPARTAAVEGNVDLRLAHVRWTRGDTAIATPAFAWHGEMHALDGRRTLESHLAVGAVHVDLGSQSLDIRGIDDHTQVAVTGDLANPEIELAQHLATEAVQQTFAPAYPLGDLALAITAERGPEGVVHVSDLKLTNGAAGTALAVTGNVDLGTSRRTLSLTTTLTQDLAKLSAMPDRFKGRGKVAVEATITSPDLVHVHARAALKGDDVSVTLPRQGIDVEQANGEVPITVSLELGKDGVSLARNEKQSPYSMLRFADQHPLLTRSGFLSIASLKTPFVSIAPLVGNLEIEQNVISLRQFEMGVRGGSITGQCGVDWDGPRSTVELHVRASGVQSSHGEPFDGNIAVVISAADRTIDGRAEVLRIGERHLLDLLDLEDPQHVDPAINRIRGALAFGYPDKLRLTFDHGFASAHLELGGLARLVSIGELRGIPMGPIVDKLLAPVLEGPPPQETP